MTDQASELRRLVGDMPLTLPRRHRRIAVTSGKGGVGKTNIALNLGLAMAEAGARVALMDADWGLSNADVLLGIKPQRGLDDVLRRRCAMEEIVREVAFGLKLLPGASGIAELANATAAEREGLLAELARLSDLADVVLVDTAPGIADPVIDMVAASDEALIVTTPEPTSLTDAYASAKVILQRRPALPVALIINMADSRAHAEEIAEGFGRVTERFLGVRVPLRGCVCADGKVADAVRRQAPLMLSHPRSLAANCIRQLASEMLCGADTTRAVLAGVR